MVKELEDSPRDEIAVLLDADAKAVAGESFEVQVRAAGSILDAYVRRGRRGVLVINSERREIQHVHSPAADWRRALERSGGRATRSKGNRSTSLGESATVDGHLQTPNAAIAKDGHAFRCRNFGLRARGPRGRWHASRTSCDDLVRMLETCYIAAA